jgi:hypothetical protein
MLTLLYINAITPVVDKTRIWGGVDYNKYKRFDDTLIVMSYS